MIDGFILRALAAGIGVALVCASLGCFVVWRRMAYFGDSLSHSALLGIALGLLWGIGVNAGILVVCVTFALALVWLQHQRILATDTLLGILAHSALSVGMVVISLMELPNFDLHSYLFGDILTVQQSDLIWIYGGGFFVIGVIISHWASLTLMTISEELAQAEGVNTFVANLILLAMMTVVVSVSVRIVGILLVSSLLIIPAATARQWARSPETMALLAGVFGVLSVILGILASGYFDTPSGPSIVTAAAVIFSITLTVQTLRGESKQSTRP